MYGSGGDSLYVGAQPIDGSMFSIGRGGFTGPMIEISHIFSNNGQRSQVAEIISRALPAYMEFAKRLEDAGLGRPLSFIHIPKTP
jgi:hypothetical protein